MNWVLAGILGYIVVQLGVGLAVSMRTKTETDYLLAGRRLGFGVATMSIFATWFGAESCIGSAGAIYADGLSGSRADPFGYALCILVMGLFFAARFWRLGLVTVGDFYRQRYGPRAEQFAVLLMVPTSLLWAAAQIRAFGQVIAASSDIGTGVAIAFAAGVVILYTSMGGLLADAITDVVQGGALVLGIVVIGAVVFIHPPDSDALRAALSPERLALRGAGEGMLARAEAWAVPIMGSLFAQELVTRTLAVRSEKIARNACLVAAGIYLLIGLIPLTLGLLGPALAPGLEDPEQLLPTLGQQYLPTVFYIMFAGAVVSAILSTVDSTLLASASLVAHNVVGHLRPHATERAKVATARGCVVAFGVIAYFIAQRSEGVYGLIEQASAFGSAGLFVAVVLGFATTRGREAAALLAFTGGLGGYVFLNYATEFATPFLGSVACALAGFAIGAMMSHREPLAATS